MLVDVAGALWVWPVFWCCVGCLVAVGGIVWLLVLECCVALLVVVAGALVLSGVVGGCG